MPKTTRFIWLGIGLTFAGLSVLFFFSILLQSVAAKPLPVYGSVADFSLSNQDGKPVSLRDLRGRIWVADIIFSRCPGPCLRMTRQMRDLQQALAGRSQAELVSLTTDPDYDTPPVLKAYAERAGADSRRWMFLTGTKKQIAGLAIDSLKFTAIEKKPEERQNPEDLFIHSTIFVLVDRHAQLRGIFQTTGDDIDPAQVKTQIVEAVQHLERER
jgi:protein SCO1/2